MEGWPNGSTTLPPHHQPAHAHVHLLKDIIAEYLNHRHVSPKIFSYSGGLVGGFIFNSRDASEWEKGTITNPSAATSVPQTGPWIYRYTAQLGCWYFRAVVEAKPQSDKGSMSQAG